MLPVATAAGLAGRSAVVARDGLAAAPTDASAFTTVTADLNQAVFNTIAIGDAQIRIFDEIRFATTFEEVVGREPAAESPAVGVPEPATIMIAVLGLLGIGLLRWRKRRRA